MQQCLLDKERDVILCVAKLQFNFSDFFHGNIMKTVFYSIVGNDERFYNVIDWLYIGKFSFF